MIQALVLPGAGIPIILGMNWMKEHKMTVNLGARSIQLTSKDGILVQVHLPSLETTKSPIAMVVETKM